MSLDEVSEALKKARYNEYVVVALDKDNENEDGEDSAKDDAKQRREAVLVACLDEDNGGIMWNDAVSFAKASVPNDAGALNAAERRDDGASSTHASSKNQSAPSSIALRRHLRTKLWMFPMLNDHRRNVQYEDAIRMACRQVQQMTACGDVREAGTRAESEEQGEADTEPAPKLIALDIGSGTGLLAMLVHRYLTNAVPGSAQPGRERGHATIFPAKVRSYDMFSEMAQIARQTVQENELEADGISVQEGHSCEIPAMIPQAHICTSELLESGLLGEGWIPAMRDAWARHLHRNAIVVPQRARVYAQLVEDTVQSLSQEGAGYIRSLWGPHDNRLPGFVGDRKFQLRTSQSPDGGSSMLRGGTGGFHHPLHAGHLIYHSKRIRCLSQPMEVLQIDVTSPENIPTTDGRQARHTITATGSGAVQAVLFWWELDLFQQDSTTVQNDTNSAITYSINPHECHANDGSWQDHWQPCIFVLPKVKYIVKGEPLRLTSFHDDSRIWFEVADSTDSRDPTHRGLVHAADQESKPDAVPYIPASTPKERDHDPAAEEPSIKRPRTSQDDGIANTSSKSSVLSTIPEPKEDPAVPPQCNTLISAYRAMQLNDTHRLQLFQTAIKNTLDDIHTKQEQPSVVLDVSDMGLCGMMASLLGANYVTSLESSSGDLPFTSARIAQLGNSLPLPASAFAASPSDNNDGVGLGAGAGPTVDQQHDYQIVQCQAEHLTSQVVANDSGTSINLVVAEPYYAVLEGWHLVEALNLHYLIHGMRRRGLLSNARVVPRAAVVYACAIESTQLHRSYRHCANPLQGFRHATVNAFGDNYSRELSLPVVNEYDFRQLSESFEIARLGYNESSAREHDGQRKHPICNSGICHAVLVWVDYDLCDGVPSVSTKTGNHHQLVRLLEEAVLIPEQAADTPTHFVSCEIQFGSDGTVDPYQLQARIETAD